MGRILSWNSKTNFSGEVQYLLHKYLVEVEATSLNVLVYKESIKIKNYENKLKFNQKWM